jgi:hypothetical protein
MYRVPPATELLSQGDIFRGRFAFSYIDDPAVGIQIVRDNQFRASADTADAWQNGSEAILSAAQVTDFVIVLSQSCDAENLQRRPLDYITLGAVIPFSELPANSHQDCKRNRLIRYHYLPADASARFPESFVHFGLLALVSQPALVAFKGSRVLALEFPYREDLGHRFGEFFSRVALP